METLKSLRNSQKRVWVCVNGERTGERHEQHPAAAAATSDDINPHQHPTPSPIYRANASITLESYPKHKDNKTPQWETLINHDDYGEIRLLVGERPLRDRFQRRSGAKLGKRVDHFQANEFVIDLCNDTWIEKEISAVGYHHLHVAFNGWKPAESVQKGVPKDRKRVSVVRRRE